MAFWKSKYKLPASFIIFFVLTFFLIGEQLVALPLYLFGPAADGADKLHLLDLPLADAIHRPFVYLIIGTVLWALFRIFAWLIAWVIGAILWALEQSFLTPLDQRPSLPSIIFFIFTFWIVLTLTPYFIYRAIDRKWGKRGKHNAILIILIINLLVLGFVASQIFYWHNSYRGQAIGHRAESTNSIPGLPPNTCPERLITQKDKPTTAYLNGQTLPVSGDVQNWVEKNCPGTVERANQP